MREGWITADEKRAAGRAARDDLDAITVDDFDSADLDRRRCTGSSRLHRASRGLIGRRDGDSKLLATFGSGWRACPADSWLFSRAVCFKAPYFGTISPLFTVLETGRCEAIIKDRRRVHNHIGTVHAIALCNLAELTAGVMTDASLPGHALDSEGHDRAVPEEGHRHVARRGHAGHPAGRQRQRL